MRLISISIAYLAGRLPKITSSGTRYAARHLKITSSIWWRSVASLGLLPSCSSTCFSDQALRSSTTNPLPNPEKSKVHNQSLSWRWLVNGTGVQHQSPATFNTDFSNLFLCLWWLYYGLYITKTVMLYQSKSKEIDDFFSQYNEHIPGLKTSGLIKREFFEGSYSWLSWIVWCCK